jgi:phospholipase/carboxylesterase
MHKEVITYRGNMQNAGRAIIMLHGRGGSAEDILSLAGYFKVKDYLIAAPQATNNSWYPSSFLAPVAQNEPWLSSALTLVGKTVSAMEQKGIKKENIVLLGFSQGACLALEYSARNATRYGGVIAFTGGLIGEEIDKTNYPGAFSNTPVFIGTSDPDPHVPVERVNRSAEILTDMGAMVTKKIYPRMGHTINSDEIETVNALFFPV